MTNPLKGVLDAAKPETLADIFRVIKFGGVLRGQIPQQLRMKTPALDAGAPASTVSTIVLPEDARAGTILGAYARGGVPGDLTVDAANTTVSSSGHCATQPDGNLSFLASDALTGVDIHYMPSRTDVIEVTLPVVTNVLTIPAVLVTRGVARILNVISNAGSVTGRLRVLAPSASAATTGTARLDLAKATVKFFSSDAVTSATVRLAVTTTADLDTLLESDSTIL